MIAISLRSQASPSALRFNPSALSTEGIRSLGLHSTLSWTLGVKLVSRPILRVVLVSCTSGLQSHRTCSWCNYTSSRAVRRHTRQPQSQANGELRAQSKSSKFGTAPSAPGSPSKFPGLLSHRGEIVRLGGPVKQIPHQTYGFLSPSKDVIVSSSVSNLLLTCSRLSAVGIFATSSRTVTEMQLLLIDIKFTC